VLDLSGKKSKKLPAWQAYSRLYYDTRVKATTNREWEEHVRAFMENRPEGDETMLPTVPPLSFCNEVTRRLFASETEDIKVEVEGYGNQTSMKDNNNDEEAVHVAQAESYHK
jgi:hypothetical protein